VGSFLNVCIYRLPLNESIVSPPSSCPNCKEKIRFYDNIPLLSYILLLGRCRYCKYPIPWRYPAVEALLGVLSLALFIRYGLSYQYILFIIFVASLVTIGFIDLNHRIIPDVLSLSGIIIGLVASFIIGHISWLDSLIGVIAGGGSLFLIAAVYERVTGREGMGGGDIKLLAMIGAWMGWRPLLLVVLIASLIGAIVGSAFILIKGKGFHLRIPFGPFLSFGALLLFFFGPEITSWYFSLFV